MDNNRPTFADITVRLATDRDAQPWDSYLQGNPDKTYAHRWSWSRVLEASFKTTPYYFIAESDGRIVGIFPTAFMKSALFGKFLISLPWLDYGGPLADNNEIAIRLVETAVEIGKQNNCQFVEMRAVSKRLPDMREKTDKREFKLRLDEGEDAVWKTFNAKARNQYRKAEKSGLTVSFGAENYLDDFYKIFSVNMRDLGTPVWPKSLFQEMFAAFPGEVEIAIVNFENKIITAGLIVHFGDYSGVPSASALREYLPLCPNNMLYWKTIKHCIERGAKVFDFGRSSETSGPFRFKKQWLKNPTEQVWQYKLLTIDNLPELNPKNPKFKLAVNVWRKLPLPLANFLGPKIVTKLP